MRKCHVRERLNQLQQQVLLRDLGIEWQLLAVLCPSFCCRRCHSGASVARNPAVKLWGFFLIRRRWSRDWSPCACCLSG